MAAARHALLYDLVRWRRYRFWLILGSAIGFALELLLQTRSQTLRNIGQYIGLAATLCISALLVLGIRTRFSYLQVKDKQLKIRILLFSQILDRDAIQSVSFVPMQKAAGRNRLPLTLRRWGETPALVLRPQDVSICQRVVRGAGQRFVWGNDIVIPVSAGPTLYETVQTEVMGRELKPARSRSRPRRRKRPR